MSGPTMRRKRRHLGALALLALVVVCFAPEAHAYPWMLRHGYEQCRPCHLDPSGAGMLRPYGRAIGEEVLRTRYAGESDAEQSRAAKPMWGIGEAIEPLEFGGDVRALLLETKPENVPFDERFILMRADLEATIDAGGWLVADATIGYAEEGALGAALTRKTEHNLVSRWHWLGTGFGTESLLLRAGRMNIPFGIRTIEHTLWVRSLTRTSINDQQEYGLAFAFAGGPVRGELMGIIGNLELRPDEFRERGYAATVEFAAAEGLGLGLSSQVLHRELDPELLLEMWRQSHGGFVRWATPWNPLVLLGEFDYVLNSPKQSQWREGPVGYLQADYEPAQGVHLIATGEFHAVGIDSPPASWGAWLSYQWFLAPHADIRLDNIYQSLGSAGERTDRFMLLAQAHFYL
jgi:hypothetical protein